MVNNGLRKWLKTDVELTRLKYGVGGYDGRRPRRRRIRLKHGGGESLDGGGVPLRDDHRGYVLGGFRESLRVDTSNLKDHAAAMMAVARVAAAAASRRRRRR